MTDQNVQQLQGVDFAIVEVMGHNTYAGKISVVSLGGAAFIRVDVPHVPEGNAWEPVRQAFTKLIGAGSIYAITPCDEEAATVAAKGLRSAAVTVIHLPERHQLAASATDEDEHDECEDET